MLGIDGRLLSGRMMKTKVDGDVVAIGHVLLKAERMQTQIPLAAVGRAKLRALNWLLLVLEEHIIFDCPEMMILDRFVLGLCLRQLGLRRAARLCRR